MKKIWILSLFACSILVAGCNNCDCNCVNENEALNDIVAYCIDHWWTHTLIENDIGPYWKCDFPNGVVCEDQLIWTDLCNPEKNPEIIDDCVTVDWEDSCAVDIDEPEVENIESGRIFACNEAITKQFNIKTFGGWWDTEQESLAWASFIINGTITYEENGTKREKTVACVVDMRDNSVIINEINTILTSFTGTSTFEELDTVVAQCEEEDVGGPYFSALRRQDFLLPYKDGYIGFYGWTFDGEGRGYQLTYRTLENPCILISETPPIFFWVHEEGKFYIAGMLESRYPQKEVKDLGCSTYWELATQCEEKINKFMYQLIVGDETQKYFSQWMTKFKDEIDKGLIRSWGDLREWLNECDERDFGINKNDPEFAEKSELAFRECVAEYWN